MKRIKDYNQSGLFVYYTGILLALIMPLGKMFLPPFIVLFFLSLIISPGFGRITHSKSTIYYLILFSLFYLLHLFGLFYSQNLSNAFSDLEIKASLLLFPGLFIFTSNKFFNKRFFIGIIIAFFAGVVVSSLISVLYALHLYFLTKDVCSLYYSNSSYFLHTSYFSLYIVFSLYLIFYQKLYKIRGKWWIIIFAVILLFYFNLLSSKAGIFTLIMALIFIFIEIIFFRRRKKELIYVFISIIVIVSSILIFPVSSSRIQNAVTSLSQSSTELKASGESTADRLLIWNAAWELSKENYWLGTGTGDVKDELIKKYTEKGMVYPAQLQLNAHNQFIQTLVALGFPALIVLILIFLIPLWISFRKKYWIYFAFLIFFGFNILVESMLEVQAGIVFFAFWNSLLWIKMQEN